MELNKNILIQIQSIIANAQQKAIHSVDTERVLMYWQIGKVIFEEEQQGKDRAEYGKYLIKSISDTFQPQFGTGFSIRQLEMNRQFYKTFPITNALRSQFSWTHYRLNIKVSNINCKKNTLQELENYMTKRQVELSRFNRRGLYKMKQFYESYINAHFVFTIANKLQILEGKVNKFVSSLLIQKQCSVAKLNNFLTQLNYLK
ncbi:MAG: DUF1016 N-terminal domain-containing protein [Phycisphaerales bacterium]|nr:DUF1016 N-terminal domain-containing protein [Phycisphaerales bacterium]